MQNKVEKKKFLGMEVRVVNGEYLVLKDMFSTLGRLRADGQLEGNDTKKLSQFLSDLSKESALKTFQISSKGKKQSKEVQDVNCLKLEVVPIVLTQFKPTARVGEDALKCWIDFMKFVDDLLVKLEVHKYIVTDKQQQIKYQDILTELGGKAMIMNTMVCEIMARLIGVEGRVKKDELRLYQDQTTIDLLDVHDFVTQQFTNAYMFSDSHKAAKEMVYNAALKKYPFEREAVA